MHQNLPFAGVFRNLLAFLVVIGVAGVSPLFFQSLAAVTEFMLASADASPPLCAVGLTAVSLGHNPFVDVLKEAAVAHASSILFT